MPITVARGLAAPRALTTLELRRDHPKAHSGSTRTVKGRGVAIPLHHVVQVIEACAASTAAPTRAAFLGGWFTAPSCARSSPWGQLGQVGAAIWCCSTSLATCWGSPRVKWRAFVAAARGDTAVLDVC